MPGSAGDFRSWQIQRHVAKEESKNIMRNTGVFSADHCRPFSLSDPSDGDFVTECDHEHDLKCDKCALIPPIFEEVESTLKDLSAIDNEEQNEMEYVITQSKKNILAWKAHLLRDINQDEARLNRLRDLDLGAILVILDWAMKFLPQNIP